jgi:hypothetical protein
MAHIWPPQSKILNIYKLEEYRTSQEAVRTLREEMKTSQVRNENTWGKNGFV